MTEERSPQPADFFPANMVGATTSDANRATTSVLRRLLRAKRIALGLRPKEFPQYGKRWAAIQKKQKARAAR